MSSSTEASTKSARVRSKGSKPISRSARAGLQFQFGRVPRFLKKGRYSVRVNAGSPVYLSSLLKYLAAQISAGNKAKDMNKTQTGPRPIHTALRVDDELCKLFDGVTIADGNYIPNHHQNRLPESSGEKGKEFGSGSLRI